MALMVTVRLCVEIIETCKPFVAAAKCSLTLHTILLHACPFSLQHQ